MLEMLRESRKSVKAGREGVIDYNNLVELNLQMAEAGSDLLSRLRDADLRLRIVGYASEGILERNAQAWLRFLNVQDRREAFPVGRRLQIEVPTGVERSAEYLTLIRGSEGFVDPKSEPPPAPRPAPQPGNGPRPSSLFPAPLGEGNGDNPAGSAPRRRFSPTGTLARVTAALEGREIPIESGDQVGLIDALKETQNSLRMAFNSQQRWGGDEVHLSMESPLTSFKLDQHNIHLVSYLNYLARTVEIPLGLRVVLDIQTPEGVHSLLSIRHIDRFRLESEDPEE